MRFQSCWKLALPGGSTATRRSIHHNNIGFADHARKHHLEQKAPPFAQWVRDILRDPIELVVEFVDFDMSDVIRKVVQKRDLVIKVLDLAPCPVTKLQNNDRFHSLLSAVDLNAVRIPWRNSAPPCQQTAASSSLSTSIRSTCGESPCLS